jgi:AraC-like DNA-binding protein
MDLVFSTDQYAAADRYDAWRGAICDVYVHVDVKAANPDRYRGFIREAKFGEVVLTDILLSEQRIRRNNQHIAQLDKECYYIQFVQRGNISVLQSGETHRSNPARGAIFSAADQYELHGHGEVRSLYLELPRDDFARRFPRERIPIAASINTTQGLGRITSEFCAALATESAKVEGDSRVQLGSQLMDMLALTLLSAENDTPGLDSSVQQARLRSVQQWIDSHIRDADLSLERIAGANGMSLRYLHRLFERCEMSASEWIWHRRLQLCYDAIAKADGRSITAIAFDHGFSSSAHFSTMFRRRYGITPRDVARRPG